MDTSSALTRHKRVLISTAHGDDLEMHFSGAAQAIQEQGGDVCSIIATDGDATTVNYTVFDFVDANDIAIRRRRESEASHQLQGIPDHYLALPDGELASGYVSMIAHALRVAVLAHDISAIVTFSPENGYCGHSDHRAMGRAALLAQKALVEDQSLDLFFINAGHEGPVRVLVNAQYKLKLLAVHETQMDIRKQDDGTYEPDKEFWNEREMQKYHPLLDEETYDRLLLPRRVYGESVPTTLS